MRIAMISSGNSIHVKKIANAMVTFGDEVTLFTLPNHNKLLKDFDSKVKIVLLPFGGKLGYLLNVPFLWNKLKKGNFDIINSHYVSGYGTLASLCNLHPLVLAVFGSDVYEFPNKSKLALNLIKRNLEKADIITSTSNIMAKRVKMFYDKKDILVTPFGVDLNIFKPLLVKKTDNSFVFGIVKKIESKYGIDILIKAFTEFCNDLKTSNVFLYIYGEGTKREEYENLSKSLNISDKVFFKGFIKNELVPEAFNSIDVACLPSLSESFGVAAVEAMACGIPVIASDVDGFTEVIDNGKTGILVERNNVKALKEAMNYMYKLSKQDRHKIGLAGIQRVRENYSIDDNMKLYHEILKTGISRR